MAEPFDSGAIAKLDWRQGAILGTKLALLARNSGPGTVSVDGPVLLIVTSHDCDIVNLSIDKEPVVEVLCARASTENKLDEQQSWGRNPRTLQLIVETDDGPAVLISTVHDRWFIPRGRLQQEAPARYLPN
jgi:hypothetical protein